MPTEFYMITGVPGSGKDTVLAQLDWFFNDMGKDFDGRFDVVSFSGMLKEQLGDIPRDQIRYALPTAEDQLPYQRNVYRQVLSMEKGVLLNMHGAVYIPPIDGWAPACPAEVHADILANCEVVGIALIEPESVEAHTKQCSASPERRRDDFPDFKISMQKEREYTLSCAKALGCRHIIIENAYVSPKERDEGEVPGMDAAGELFSFIEAYSMANVNF